MTSNRDRQRAAARARLEREMAERAEQLSQAGARRNTTIAAGGRRLWSSCSVVAWLVIALPAATTRRTATPPPSSASAAPTELHVAAAGRPDRASPDPEIPKDVKDVGTPPTTGEPRTAPRP